MKRKSFEHLSIFELVKMYTDAALLHGRSIDTGDSKTANKQYYVLEALCKELLTREAEGRAAILRLMTSEEPWVRLVAAGDALRFDPNRAEPVLEALATIGGFCGFTARMSLREWRKGNIKFND